MRRTDRIREEWDRASSDEEREALIEKWKSQGLSRAYILRVLERKKRSRNPGNEEERVARIEVVPRTSKEPGSFVRMLPTEIVPPEVAVRNFRLQDGDYRDGFVDGIGMMLLTARYNQILAASQAEIIRGQLEIYERSKASVAEVARAAAREAAEETGEGITQWLMKEKPWRATSPNPFENMITELMKPVLQNIINSFLPKLSGQTPQTPPGFVIEEE